MVLIAGFEVHRLTFEGRALGAVLGGSGAKLVLEGPSHFAALLIGAIPLLHP